jgi:4a-hydroxytetrahydrobiopterin dehydratase
MDWNTENNKLVKEFKFNDFVEALAFIVRVGELAESSNHHPKIINEYNKVRLELCTHSEGHIVTSKDWELANAIDAL